MTARAHFWYLFAEMVYRQYYLEEYKCQLSYLNKALSFVALVVTCTGIAGWNWWKSHTTIWSIAVGVGQLISLVLPYLELQKDIIYIDFCIPCLKELVDEMNGMWRNIDSIKDNEILEHMHNMDKQYSALDGKFINPLDLPDNKRCQKKAMDKRDKFLKPLLENVESEVVV